MMDNRILGVIIGVVGIFVWFMPFYSFEFRGIPFYQTGYHIGGIAYLLLVSMAAYSVFSWFNLHPLRIISAVVAFLISLMFIIGAFDAVDWGLIVMFLASIIGIVLGIIDYKKQKVTNS